MKSNDISPTTQTKNHCLEFLSDRLNLEMAGTMAASSGGLDWATFLKPFLSVNSENSNKNELFDLCTAILKRYNSTFGYL